MKKGLRPSPDAEWDNPEEELSQPPVDEVGRFRRKIEMFPDEKSHEVPETLEVEDVLLARVKRHKSRKRHQVRKSQWKGGEPPTLIDGILPAAQDDYLAQDHPHIHELRGIFRELNRRGLLRTQMSEENFLKKVFSVASNVCAVQMFDGYRHGKITEASACVDLITEIEIDLGLFADLPPEWWAVQARGARFLADPPNYLLCLEDNVYRSARAARYLAVVLQSTLAGLRQELASVAKRPRGRPPRPQGHSNGAFVKEAVYQYRNLWREVKRAGGARSKDITTARFIKAAFIATGLPMPTPLDDFEQWLVNHMDRGKGATKKT